MPGRARLLVNIDVPSLARAEAFYTAVLGVTPGRRMPGAVELLGLDAPVYLLEQAAGTGTPPRDYARHWTPVHLDVAVDDLAAATARAETAGATAEGAERSAPWGRIRTFADPFGHGFCLIQFSPEGYDAIAT